MPRKLEEAIGGVLNAFVALVTQPFEQEIGASVRAAALAISLGGLEGMVFLARNGIPSALEFGVSALVLVLVWIIVTAILANRNRVSAIARNLSILSFWIAATMVFVIAMELIFHDTDTEGIRFYSCIAVLLVLVPIHLFHGSARLFRGSMRFFIVLGMTLALWFSTGFLAYRVIYANMVGT